MPLFWLGLRVLGLPRFQARLQRSTVKRHAGDERCPISRLWASSSTSPRATPWARAPA
ncbi:MAG: hypothetical protein IPL15_07510 [Comamonadaceae bacterium]|uniref:hypothetical protein n=1 Tax=Candidatus Skiveiella danica TaxID=3386177 RepID=UPI00390C3A04|nr:hypothetical protein [Comamonadaceae bacterium]